MGGQVSTPEFKIGRVYKCNYKETQMGPYMRSIGEIPKTPITLIFKRKNVNSTYYIFQNYDIKKNYYSININSGTIYNYSDNDDDNAGVEIGQVDETSWTLIPLSGGGVKQFYKGYYYNLHTVNKKQFIKTKGGQVSIAAVRAWQKRALK